MTDQPHELLKKYFGTAAKKITWENRYHGLTSKRHAMVMRSNGDPLFLRHENGIVLNIPNHLYHMERSHISSTGLRMFADNPGKFKRLYIDEIADEQVPDNEYLVLGSAVHAILFEPEQLDSRIIEITSPEEGKPFNRRIKLHRQYEASLRRKNADKIVLTKEDLELAFSLADSVRTNSLAMRLIESKSVLREAALFARQPDAGVRVKCKLDMFVELEGKPTIVDAKTVRGNSSPDGFATTIARYGYDVAAAHYCLCFQAVTGVWPDFVFMVIEKDDQGDHQCLLHKLDEESLRFAIDETIDTLKDLAMCKYDEFVSPYSNKINTVSLPGWRFKNRRKSMEDDGA